MQQRYGAHGAGTWSVPGGHLEFGESFEDTARRETREETSLEITNVCLAGITNDIFDEEGKHYVTIWMMSDWLSGEPHIMEPDKCLQQLWCDFDNLPAPLFLPWNQLLTSDFIDAVKKQIS